jgi:rod shape-determining protein MreC
MKTSGSGFWQTATLLLVGVGLVLFALSGYMTPLFGSMLSPLVNIQEWLATRYIAVYEFVTVPRDVATLRARNQQLEQEVTNLQAQIIELQQQLREAQVLYALLDFARSNPQGGQYVAAAVVGKDPNPFLKYVFIDRGSDDGLRRGMPVITNQGLVGQVDAVTATAARVRLITDPSSVVNVRIEPHRSEAQLVGSVTGDLTVEMVSQDAPLQPGDLVLTSGLGGTFPSDLLIGQVISVRKQSNELFQSGAVQPVVDFSTLQAVLVITNFRPVDFSPLIPTTVP